MKKSKVYTIYKKITVVENTGKRVILTCQPYQTGLYVIIDNNPSFQYNLTLAKMNNITRKLNRDLSKYKLESVLYENPIKIQVIDDLYKIL